MARSGKKSLPCTDDRGGIQFASPIVTSAETQIKLSDLPIGAPSSDPLAATLAGERQREIRLAVAALGEPYREVLALRFFGDMSLEEIAQATRRPVNTVKTHLRRGLQRLRPILGREVAA